MSNHWDDLSQLWALLAPPPLKPSPADTAFLNARIAEMQSTREIRTESSELNALILGVTPEYYRLEWPRWTRLQAIDKAAAMIASVWPGPPGSATQSVWTELPLPDACLDMVVCDGGLNSLLPGDVAAVASTLARTLKPQGLFCVRLFSKPQQQEGIQQVFDDLRNHHIPNMNVFKLRLGMAMQESIESGVELNDLWSVFTEWTGDLEHFAINQRWPLPEVTAINAYRNSSNRYYFYSIEEITGLFLRKNRFDCTCVLQPDYVLGDRCPTLVFKRI